MLSTIVNDHNEHRNRVNNLAMEVDKLNDELLSLKRRITTANEIVSLQRAIANAKNTGELYLDISHDGKEISGATESSMQGDVLNIVLQDNIGMMVFVALPKNSKLETIFNTFASLSGMPVKSICRLKHKDCLHEDKFKYLFLSHVKTKTFEELDIKEGDYLIACTEFTNTPSTATDTNDTVAIKSISNEEIKIVRPGKPHRRSPWTGSVDQKSEEYYKNIHSKQMDYVFKQAEPMFDQIRKVLNDSSIKRDQPKDKSKQLKPVLSGNEHFDSADAGVNWLGSKAGIGSFLVNVGEVKNLYKTSKRHKHIPSNPKFTLDLHGHTKDEAESALNKNLSVWIKTAMGGKYPFVIPVKIVCGKGSQILSEVVAKWIKNNKQVAKACKSKK